VKRVGYGLEEGETRVGFLAETRDFCFTASETVMKSTLYSLAAHEIMTCIPTITLERIHFTPYIHWMSHDPFLF
jgi:hypothetical protein